MGFSLSGFDPNLYLLTRTYSLVGKLAQDHKFPSLLNRRTERRSFLNVGQNAFSFTNDGTQSKILLCAKSLRTRHKESNGVTHIVRH